MSGEAASGSRWLAARPESLGVDSARLEALVARAEGELRGGEIPSLQLALAREGELVAHCTFGERAAGSPADNRTLYAAFSTTKAITASATWILIQEGRLDLDAPVADAIPEFAARGKGGVRVEQLLTHTAGFPNACFDARDWDDRERRLATFAAWELEWEPGSRFAYHPASSMWVLAELIERRAGCDFREFVRERVAAPLGLEDLYLGLPPELGGRVAEIVPVGEAPDLAQLAAAKLRIPPEMIGGDDGLLRFNRPDLRAVGVPGGGGLMTAADLALFYQALLHEGRSAAGVRVWTPEMIEAARQIRTGALTDPMTGQVANRGLGLVIAGDATRVFRAFAPENSPEAFGHPGAGCQVAWADPATGISFALFTNGMERDPLRMGTRGLALSSLAAVCARGAG